MISDTHSALRSDDEIVTNGKGQLSVSRVVSLNVCRCRQCSDNCELLAEPPHVLCVHCNNNHSQSVDGRFVGPFTGSRGARALQQMSTIRAQPDPTPSPPTYRYGIPGITPDACPICGTIPACSMDCR